MVVVCQIIKVLIIAIQKKKTAGVGICAGKKLKNRFHSMTDQKSADGVTGVLMGKALPA